MHVSHTGKVSNGFTKHDFFHVKNIVFVGVGMFLFVRKVFDSFSFCGLYAILS